MVLPAFFGDLGKLFYKDIKHREKAMRPISFFKKLKKKRDSFSYMHLEPDLWVPHLLILSLLFVLMFCCTCHSNLLSRLSFEVQGIAGLVQKKCSSSASPKRDNPIINDIS